ncbi:MAG: molybdopterin molybdotransferase MoeA [Actinomycetota bacterium]|nr:molybdopterin molybdotransferase MoeA [Actinomycetota bacterium]
MIELDEARQRLLAACPPIEPVLLRSADATGCVLAADVVAGVAVPPFDNTSLDGYAVRSSDLHGASHDRPVTLEVLGSVLAGSVAERPVAAGQAWKVMTGAPLPAGADAVVMVENSSAHRAQPLGSAGDRVALSVAVQAGTGIRLAGSDVQAGDLVLAAGTVLRAAHLGVLASVGADRVRVYPRLRVGVLVTGDELVTDGRPLAPGQIYESNRAMLMSLLRKANCEPIDLGVAGDDLAALERRLAMAIVECDVVISSGGVSMGDSDPIKAVLERLGRLNWMQIAIRPAKPFAFGVLDGPTLLMGLPGNPVSSLVSFELLARPALLHLMGHAKPNPTVVLAIADQAITRPNGDGRTAYLRVGAEFGPDGRLHVRPVRGQDSHQLAASAAADALARLADGQRVEAGGEVEVLLLS